MKKILCGFIFLFFVTITSAQESRVSPKVKELGALLTKENSHPNDKLFIGNWLDGSMTGIVFYMTTILEFSHLKAFKKK